MSTTIERTWEAHGLACAVIWIASPLRGHRCGYVRVPEGHPFHGLSYSDPSPIGPVEFTERAVDDAGMGGMIAALAETLDEWSGRIEGALAVHGGVTFAGEIRIAGTSDGWWFGFDCAHHQDTPAIWTLERTAAETERLAEQLAAIAARPAREPSSERYPAETVHDDEDDGTMPENVAALAQAVVGHRIVNAEQESGQFVLTLDTGARVKLRDTSDCCAFTDLEAFLLHPDRVDHAITGVGTTEGFTKWHIYADFGDVVEMDVGWSCGNPFYYAYGFDIAVEPVEELGA